METIRFYGVDGYHGGRWGHMPMGSFRDILNMLRAYPAWRLSLDIEPASWEELKRRDPETYRAFARMLNENDPRLELVAPSYAQPYPWAIDGESVIRHLLYGMREVKRHFPRAVVTTYAVQEPCFTSALPQILRSMGYALASLKNPSTAWAGYCAGFDAERINWIGPDGTAIPAIPRYACEGLVRTWQTESCLAREEFISRCIARGISRPAGMYYQDVGWRAYPFICNADLQDEKQAYPYARPDTAYATWREYARLLGDQPMPNEIVTQEDFRVALPWGDEALTDMARHVRAGERALLMSHALVALGRLFGGEAMPKALENADRRVMLSQHHDAWICAAGGTKENNWARRAIGWSLSARELMKDCDDEALDALSAACGEPTMTGEETVMVINRLGRRENAYMRLPFTADRGTRDAAVSRGGQALPSQLIPTRFYADGSVCAGELIAYAPVDGFGISAFDVRPLTEKMEIPSPLSASLDENRAVLENELYIVTLDLNRGGCVSSLVCKADGFEVVPANAAFNVYRGYFMKERRLIGSDEAPAKAEILYIGALEMKLRVTGAIGDATFTQEITLRAHDPVLHVRVTFHFMPDTLIGDPIAIDESNVMAQRERSYHDGRMKLSAWFPTAFRQARVDKDAAYDVCLSRLENTYFKGWDEIKHNILLNFVCVGDGRRGLAVLSDHTEAYTQGDDLLGLTMAWAGDGGYWWRHRALSDDCEREYGIMPYRGDWRQGDVWHESQKWQSPACLSRLGGHVKVPDALATIKGGLTEITYVGAEDNATLLRLFNPGEDEKVILTLRGKMRGRAALVTLDGREIERADSQMADDAQQVLLTVPHFGIRTLRITREEERNG